MDRRRYPRRETEGLVVVIGGRSHSVIDLSRGGISFRGEGLPANKILIAELAHSADPYVGETVFIRVREMAEGMVHAEFNSSDVVAIPEMAAPAPVTPSARRRRAAKRARA